MARELSQALFDLLINERGGNGDADRAHLFAAAVAWREKYPRSYERLAPFSKDLLDAILEAHDYVKETTR
jgi:hypothetical protein